SGEFGFVSVQGLKSSGPIRSSLGRAATRDFEIVGLEECLVVSQNDFGKNLGFHIFVKAEHSAEILSRLEKQNLKILGLELWKMLRAEAGYFALGIDINEKNTIVESSLASHVARDKGCYPGQEVVERVFTYGNVSKKLVMLKPIGDPTEYGAEAFKAGVKVLSGDDEAGVITSVVFVPWSGNFFAFGLIRRPH